MPTFSNLLYYHPVYAYIIIPATCTIHLILLYLTIIIFFCKVEYLRFSCCHLQPLFRIIAVEKGIFFILALYMTIRTN
jgi:hypothetical protein